MKSFVFSVLIVLSMSDRDYWWTEGLVGDAREEDAGQTLGLAVGGQKTAEERFLLELDENISVQSELVEEGMEQNKEEVTPQFLESLAADRNPHLYRTHWEIPAKSSQLRSFPPPHANQQYHSDPIHLLHHHHAQGWKEIYS